MRRLLQLCATLAVALASAVQGHTAEIISYRSSGGLGEIRSQGRLGRVTSGRKGYMLNNNGRSFALLPPDGGADGLKAGRLLTQYGAAVASATDGINSVTRAANRIGPLDESLVGRLHASVLSNNAGRVFPSGTLPMLSTYLNDLIAERLDIPGSKTLDPADLKSIMMPNRTFRFEHLGSSAVAMTDTRTGFGVLTIGDPYIHKILPGSAPTVHYSTWNSNVVVYMLPGEDGSSMPMAVILWSDGQSGNFGYVTQMLALSASGRWLFAEGLNGGSPTGSQGEGGALDAYRAFASDAGRASLLYWVPEEHELRTSDGDRLRPPAGAGQYTSRQPASRPTPAELFDRLQFVKTNSAGDLPADFRELGERFRQSLTARSSAVPAIKAVGEAYVEKAKAFARVMLPYIAERQKLAEQARQMAETLGKITEEIYRPGQTSTRANELAAQAAEIEAQASTLLNQVDELDGKVPAPPL